MQKHKYPGKVKCLADGFIIILDEKEHKISCWEEIDQVNAFKIDLITTDEICVQINIGGKYFVLTEKSIPGL